MQEKRSETFVSLPISLLLHAKDLLLDQIVFKFYFHGLPIDTSFKSLALPVGCGGKGLGVIE